MTGVVYFWFDTHLSFEFPSYVTYGMIKGVKPLAGGAVAAAAPASATRGVPGLY